MTGYRVQPATVATAKLSMTGYRTQTTAIATAKLSMTGYRTQTTTVATPKLSMTGYRTQTITVATPKLSMTGYRTQTTAIATPKLSMTGYRFQPAATLVTPQPSLTGFPADFTQIKIDPLKIIAKKRIRKLKQLTTDPLVMTGMRKKDTKVPFDKFDDWGEEESDEFVIDGASPAERRSRQQRAQTSVTSRDKRVSKRFKTAGYDTEIR